jgi:hypothetical protein
MSIRLMPEQLAERLTMFQIEVEGVDKLAANSRDCRRASDPRQVFNADKLQFAG